MSVDEIQAMKARIAPHVFDSQYQQRPAAGGTGYCDDRTPRALRRSARRSSSIVHSWDIAATKGGGDWTVCAKFGLARESKEATFCTSSASSACRSRLPEVREAIIARTNSIKPALILMDGNGVGRGVYQDLWVGGFPASIAGRIHHNFRHRQPQDAPLQRGLFYLYDGLVQLPKSMLGLENCLTEMAAFPRWEARRPGRRAEHVAAYFPRVVSEARRLGRQTGRLAEPVIRRVAPPAKSRDQELHERRQWRETQ